MWILAPPVDQFQLESSTVNSPLISQLASERVCVTWRLHTLPQAALSPELSELFPDFSEPNNLLLYTL